MNVSVDQDLLKAIAQHRAGNLQDADRLYRSVLEVQPLNPDANHNLGLLMISGQESAAAIPLFRAAVKANPYVEQFWLSYIDALFKDNQPDSARLAIKKAKKKGFSSKKLNSLAPKHHAKRSAPSDLSLDRAQRAPRDMLDYLNSGQYLDAQKYASLIIQQDPDHQLAWKVLGVALGLEGKSNEALKANQKAAALSPHDPDIQNNLGNTFRDLGRLDEAVESYSQAIVLNSTDAQFFSNLGLTLQEIGRINESVDYLMKAIDIDPNYGKAFSTLSASFKLLGKFEEAEKSLRKAMSLEPNQFRYHNSLGTLMLDQGRSQDAEDSFSKVLFFDPGDEFALFNLGIFNKSIKKYDKAIKYFRQCSSKESGYYILACLFDLDDQSNFYIQLDHLIDEGEINARIGSLGCRGLIRYGVEKENLFCKDPLNYILHTNLNDNYDFLAELIVPIRSILESREYYKRKQSLLSNGIQSGGNLFNDHRDLVGNIEDIIRREIESYKNEFKNSREGLISKWPSEYKLLGWIVSMESGGELRPHIHESGWISGSIYINVPQKWGSQSGNLVVSVGKDSDVLGQAKNLKESINVITGSLVLFPSSVMHHTIPFESEENRIVIAFDVMPNT